MIFMEMTDEARLDALLQLGMFIKHFLERLEKIHRRTIPVEDPGMGDAHFLRFQCSAWGAVKVRRVIPLRKDGDVIVIEKLVPLEDQLFHPPVRCDDAGGGMHDPLLKPVVLPLVEGGWIILLRKLVPWIAIIDDKRLVERAAQLFGDQKIGERGGRREDQVKISFLKKRLRRFERLAFPPDLIIRDEERVAN